MKTSQRGIDLIKKFEGLELKAYLCPANVWTIGYGTTSNIKEGDIIDEETAELFLKKDVIRFENNVNTYVKVELSQNEFDALVSFTYNLGGGALKRSTLLKKLNEKNYTGASKEFDKWVKAGGRVLRGLVKRRKAERRLFGEW